MNGFPKLLLALIILTVTLAPGPARAASTGTEESTAVETPVKPLPATAPGTSQGYGERFATRWDAFHRGVSDMVLNSAGFFDDFFSDERFLMEDNQTRLIFKPGISVNTDGDTDTRMRFSFRLNLPRVEKRLHLLLSSNVDDEEGLSRTPLEDPFDRAHKSDSLNAALQYTPQTSQRHNLSFHLGLRTSGVQAYGGGRYRYLAPIGEWEFRFIQRARWYTDDGFEFRTTTDFDRPLSRTWLFRMALEGAWYEEEEGFFYAFSPALHQYLAKDMAIKYEWATHFETDPCHRMDHTAVRARFRHRIWRDWFLYEIIPEVSFPREKDYKALPGISLNLEIQFGRVPKAGTRI